MQQGKYAATKNENQVEMQGEVLCDLLQSRAVSELGHAREYHIHMRAEKFHQLKPQGVQNVLDVYKCYTYW